MLLDTSGRSIHSKEDRKSDDTSDETDDIGYLEETEQEVAIDRAMGQYVSIWRLGEFTDPVEKTGWKRLGAFLLAQTGNEGPGSILATLGTAQDKEDQDENAGDDKDGYEGSDQAREGDGGRLRLDRRSDDGIEQMEMGSTYLIFPGKEGSHEANRQSWPDCWAGVGRRYGRCDRRRKGRAGGGDD